MKDATDAWTLSFMVNTLREKVATTKTMSDRFNK